MHAQFSRELYKDLLDVMKHALGRLKLLWERVQEETFCGRLDEQHLSGHCPSAPVSLLFLSNLHSEIEKDGRTHIQPASIDIVSGGASTLKALPTKPLKTNSRLNGKAYMAAGQAGALLHTMAVLHAYQADLLKDSDQGQGLPQKR